MSFACFLSVPLDCYFLRQHRRCKTFLVSAGRIKVDSLVWVRDAFSIHLYLQSPLCPSRTFCLRNGCSCARRCQETRCQEKVVSGSVASASSVSSDDQHWWWCWRRRRWLWWWLWRHLTHTVRPTIIHPRATRDHLFWLEPQWSNMNSENCAGIIWSACLWPFPFFPFIYRKIPSVFP